MQCSVRVSGTIVVELGLEADMSQMETTIEEVGRQAMRAALGHAVRRRMPRVRTVAARRVRATERWRAEVAAVW